MLTEDKQRPPDVTVVHRAACQIPAAIWVCGLTTAVRLKDGADLIELFFRHAERVVQRPAPVVPPSPSVTTSNLSGENGGIGHNPLETLEDCL